MDQRPSLSAVVITLDSATCLAQCLQSLRFADEILVVDAGSTDGTLDIARGHGARTIHRDWNGFGLQKRFAVQQALHHWVLCIDSDERVPETLATAILACLGSTDHRAFEMPRMNRFLGSYLRHGEGYPDWSLRLFDRRHAQWTVDEVHEKVATDRPAGRIRHGGALLHESAVSLHAYLEKQNRYTSLQAHALLAAGTHESSMRMLISPLFRFFKFYVWRAGFLDGIPGLVHITIGCFNSFMKYAKLRELRGGGR